MADTQDFASASQALAGLEQLDLPAMELMYKLECSGEDFYNLLAERIGNEDAAVLLRRNGKEELGHARKFATRIKELYGVVPGSLGFSPEQHSLQPPEQQTDIVHVIRGVIDAERSGIQFYNEIIEAADQVDPVTQDATFNRRSGRLKDRSARWEGILRPSFPSP